jgi:Ca2+:H+ antiporter
MLGAIVVAAAVAGILRYTDAPAIPAFLVATVALAGMAWTVSFSTEQVGARFGPAVTGVLQSSLGNLPEFFVVIFALNSGQKVVAETSILGSILVNALLVLGLVLVVGARKSEDGIMRFRKRLPNDTATLLLISVFIILLVALSVGSSDRASHHVKAISIVGAVCLLAAYVAWLIPYLKSDVPTAPGERAEEPAVPLPVSLALLAVAGVGSAFVSDWFVHALTPTIDKVVGLVLASKGQSDLAISIVKNSVAQIAAFLYPALVLVSLLFSTTLTFSLAPVYVGALLGTALVIWQITGDGEASEFEGWALVATFVILATVALYE